MKSAVSCVALSVVCLVSLWILPGCGGASRPTNRPETVPASGTVTYQGKPVAGATVTFVADSPASARGAVARTDESGQFKLTTFDAGDGAIPGNYRVTVAKMDATAVAENLDPTVPPPPPPKSVLPEKFADPNTSGLTAEVKQDGENKFPFDLGS
jgi:hypothetical protein